MKLAERYLGMNMADTALHICTRGLETNPEHLAGRVLLTRIYIAKGMGSEARAQLTALRATDGDAPELPELAAALAQLDAPGAGTRSAASAAPAAAAVPDASRQELQALEMYLGRLRRELTRVVTS